MNQNISNDNIVNSLDVILGQIDKIKFRINTLKKEIGNCTSYLMFISKDDVKNSGGLIDEEKYQELQKDKNDFYFWLDHSKEELIINNVKFDSYPDMDIGSPPLINFRPENSTLRTLIQLLTKINFNQPYSVDELTELMNENLSNATFTQRYNKIKRILEPVAEDYTDYNFFCSIKNGKKRIIIKPFNYCIILPSNYYELFL